MASNKTEQVSIHSTTHTQTPASTCITNYIRHNDHKSLFFTLRGFWVHSSYDRAICHRGHYMHVIHEENEGSVYEKKTNKKTHSLRCATSYMWRGVLLWLLIPVPVCVSVLVTWPVKCMAMPGQTCQLISYWTQMTGEGKQTSQGAALKHAWKTKAVTRMNEAVQTGPHNRVKSCTKHTWWCIPHLFGTGDDMRSVRLQKEDTPGVMGGEGSTLCLQKHY